MRLGNKSFRMIKVEPKGKNYGQERKKCQVKSRFLLIKRKGRLQKPCPSLVANWQMQELQKT